MNNVQGKPQLWSLLAWPRVPKLLQPSNFHLVPHFEYSFLGEITMNFEFLLGGRGGGFHGTFLVLTNAISNLPNLDMASFVINFVPSKFQSMSSFGSEFLYFFDLKNMISTHTKDFSMKKKYAPRFPYNF